MKCEKSSWRLLKLKPKEPQNITFMNLMHKYNSDLSPVLIAFLSALIAMGLAIVGVTTQNTKVLAVLIVGIVVFLAVLIFLTYNRYRFMAKAVLLALIAGVWSGRSISLFIQVDENTLLYFIVEAANFIEPISLTLCFIVLMIMDLITNHPIFKECRLRIFFDSKELNNFFDCVDKISQGNNLSPHAEQIKFAKLLEKNPHILPYLNKAATIVESTYKAKGKSSQAVINWGQLERYLISHGYNIYEANRSKIIIEPKTKNERRKVVVISEKCSNKPSAVVMTSYLQLIERIFGIAIDDIRNDLL